MKRAHTANAQALLLAGLVMLLSLWGIFSVSSPSVEDTALGTMEALDEVEGGPHAEYEEIAVEEEGGLFSRVGSSTTTHRVTRVVDGDTIEVMYNGVPRRVRYIGIDTPETVHPSKPVECFGTEAATRNKDLVLGREVHLVRDISDTDKYGRLLRYVYVDNVFVNYALVSEGYAHARSYPPDVTYSDIFRQAERDAREGGRGLWGSVCESEVNSYAPDANSLGDNGTCSIKGNINLEGEKIYHTVGCEYYEKTRIDESAGERWFCSEEEALDAGWRKALNC